MSKAHAGCYEPSRRWVTAVYRLKPPAIRLSKRSRDYKTKTINVEGVVISLFYLTLILPEWALEIENSI